MSQASVSSTVALGMPSLMLTRRNSCCGGGCWRDSSSRDSSSSRTGQGNQRETEHPLVCSVQGQRKPMCFRAGDNSCWSERAGGEGGWRGRRRVRAARERRWGGDSVRTEAPNLGRTTTCADSACNVATGNDFGKAQSLDGRFCQARHPGLLQIVSRIILSTC